MICLTHHNHEPPKSSKAQNQHKKDTDVVFTFKINRAKISNMGLSKTSDHIQIKIKMPNSSQEPPVSSKAPNEDLKYMDVLFTFKIRIESKN